MTLPTTPSSPASRRNLTLAVLGVAVLTTLLVWAMFPSNPPPPSLSTADQANINQALQSFYATLPNGSPESIDKITPGQTKPPEVQTTILSVTQRKNKKQLKVSVQISINNTPPPDGITQRIITLVADPQGQWQVQPILPLGADALTPPSSDR